MSNCLNKDIFLMDDFPSFFKIIFEPKGDLAKLGIPIKFMAKYGSDLSEVVSLKVPIGSKTWKFQLFKENHEKAWFRDGWPEFVDYYLIRHGHFLVFTYGGRSEFNVLIFDKTSCEIEYPLDNPRETMDIPKYPTSVKGKGITVPQVQNYRAIGGRARNLTREEIELINSYQSENPAFAVLMQPSYVEYKFRWNVPKKFVDEYFSASNQACIVLENESGDTWQIKGRKSRLNKFTVAWKNFALGNNLRVGDICVFQLTKKVTKATKYMFKVQIIRHSSTGVAVSSASKKSPDDTLEVISIDD